MSHKDFTFSKSVGVVGSPGARRFSSSPSFTQVLSIADIFLVPSLAFAARLATWKVQIKTGTRRECDVERILLVFHYTFLWHSLGIALCVPLAFQ